MMAGMRMRRQRQEVAKRVGLAKWGVGRRERWVSNLSNLASSNLIKAVKEKVGTKEGK